MKFKKMIALFVGAIAFTGAGFLATNSENTAQAAFRENNTFSPYATVVTADATWGANLFNGNDGNKSFNRILPRGSQWQAYGYTRRSDGYYYWLGGNQWVQGNQVKIPIQNRWDAFLDVVAKFGDVDNSEFSIMGNSVDIAPWEYYGDYGNGIYMTVDENPIDWSSDQYRSHFYYVYQDGYATIEY